MSFFIGFLLGAVVTLYLFYRKAKKNQKNESVRKPSSDKRNEKEDEYL